MSTEVTYTQYEEKKRQELVKAISVARAAKTKAEATASDISTRKEHSTAALRKSEELIEALEEAMEDIQCQLAALGAPSDSDKWIKALTKQQIEEAKSLRSPPKTLESVMAAVYILLNAHAYTEDNLPGEVPWKDCKSMLNRSDFLAKVQNYDINSLIDSPAVAHYISTHFLPPDLEPP
eukprot:CAMPEP_0197848592 /NCGR_PEP_ID=MMETSP1438-20131217/9264_1 /TAXON_ID=1461541 /ORGANISM="Pterosperma sp., Strain CCMP1384" /LENGTH=178 /DNA_ID=CAMNT_0043460917 /DNA_START=112 /DNA_END=644 /DNA_ORIENTATION=+